jgi:hypothetical protein
MKWFRLWVDILDDHKINQLNDYEFRCFIYLLACASEEDAVNGRLTRTLPAINRRCRRRNDHFNRAIETFHSLELITLYPDGILQINNWNKRQFQSDKSYERVKKHRQQAAVRNVSVTVNETPPDTDTDTDKKKIYKRKGNGFAVPTIEEISAYCSERSNNVDPEKWFDYYQSKGWLIGKAKMRDWKAAIRTWEKSDFNKAKQPSLDEWAMK